jgi:hypothetical protein
VTRKKKVGLKFANTVLIHFFNLLCNMYGCDVEIRNTVLIHYFADARGVCYMRCCRVGFGYQWERDSLQTSNKRSIE